MCWFVPLLGVEGWVQLHNLRTQPNHCTLNRLWTPELHCSNVFHPRRLYHESYVVIVILRISIVSWDPFDSLAIVHPTSALSSCLLITVMYDNGQKRKPTLVVWFNICLPAFYSQIFPAALYSSLIHVITGIIPVITSTADVGEWHFSPIIFFKH